jgi:cyclohexanecarboxylate-CoA ligase
MTSMPSDPRATTARIRPTRLDPEAARRYRANGWWTGRPLGSLLDEAAAAAPTATALVDGPHRLTFADVHDRAGRVAAGLHGIGVGPGDVVMAQLPTWWESIVVAHAVFRLGAVLNPVLPNYGVHELSHMVRAVDPRAIVVPAVHRGVDAAARARSLAPGRPVVTVRAGPTDGEDLDLDRLLGADRPAPPPVPNAGDDPALLLFTSGTTGAPKCAIHTHDTLGAEAAGLTAAHALTADDVVLFTMPFAHIGGIIYGVLAPVLARYRTVLLAPWDPGAALDLIERETVTVQPSMPVYLRGVLAHPAFSRERVRSLRLYPMGGARVTALDVRDATARLGCPSRRTYGLTEMPTLSTGPVGDPRRRHETTEGVPIGHNEIRIVDEDGTPVPTGEVGEITCRGPELCVGYVDAAQNEGAFTADGWFRTGDLGTVDADGFLTVVGRLKDIIIRGGENVSPAEVELLLLEHASVEDVAIVGMPDPVYGERACAFVETADEAFDLAAATAHLQAAGLASFKLPERLERRSSLPRNENGKVDRTALRAEAATIGGAQWTSA